MLNNNGYRFEHSFGHGKKTPASLLAAMNVLECSLHHSAEMAEKHWQAAREYKGQLDSVPQFPWLEVAYAYDSDRKAAQAV